MANKDNQSKQYRIYIKESKSWVDVNKEFYTVTSTPTVNASRNMAVVSALQANAIYATWTV